MDSSPSATKDINMESGSTGAGIVVAVVNLAMGKI